MSHLTNQVQVEKKARIKALGEIERFAELFGRAETERSLLNNELFLAKDENKKLRELLERLCESVAENWDQGLADYFRVQAKQLTNGK